MSPSRFDVIVTDNMFGDIITDLGAMIQGGMGVAAGGNINPERRRRCSSRSAARRPTTPARGRSTRSRRSRAVQMLLATLGEDRAADRVDTRHPATRRSR